MKTLPALRTEIDLGMMVYPATNHDVAVWVEAANAYHEKTNLRSNHPRYVFSRTFKTPVERGTDEEKDEDRRPDADISHHYFSFDQLLEDWPMLASSPVWSTAKTPERIAYDEALEEAYRQKHDKASTPVSPDMWRESYEYLRRDMSRLYVALDALQSGHTASIKLASIDNPGGGCTFELPDLFERVYHGLRSVENMVKPDGLTFAEAMDEMERNFPDELHREQE